MDLPVEKWKVYVSQKWALLEPFLKEKLSHPTSLKDSFLFSFALFHPGDEEYLLSLSKQYCVKKDPTVVPRCKEEGNRRFQEKEYNSAAVLYSRALSHAEAGSPEMAVCYANRSAALFRLGQFEVCLEDIRRAEEGGYPDRLSHKILLRKAECLLSLGRWAEMAEALGSVENTMLANQSLDTASHQVLLQKVTQLKAKACKEKSRLVPRPTVTGGVEADSETWNENSRVSCASSSVRLSFSPSKGRHLVATTDILPGEILVREEAFVSVLRPGEQLLCQGSSAKATLDGALGGEDLHCHHCLRQLLASVPCQGCSYAKYCSHVCAQLAWKSYHRRECPLGGLLLTLGVFCHVAFRAVLVAGFAEVRRSVEEWPAESLAEALAARSGTEEGSVALPGCDADGGYRSSYRAAFSLLSHSEKHRPEFRFLCSLSVAALCKGLRDSGLEAPLLGKDTAETLNRGGAAEAPPGLEVLGAAMLRHTLQLQCNAQAVTTVRVAGSKVGPVASSKQVCLATAVFPVLSLLNHSCDPNTSVTFSGRTAEVRASQPIPQGQEILHCYGPHRCRMGAEERRKRLLSQYFFECCCPPCTEELGPTSRDGASSRLDFFCCPTCHGSMQGEGLLRCSGGFCKALLPEEGFRHQLRDLRQLTEAAVELLEQGKPGQSVELLQRCQLKAKRFLSPGHLLVGEIEDRLAQAHVILGKWPEAAAHLRKSIQVVEAHYGSSSIEVGQELFKLAQVLFNGRAILEALRAVEKAEAVLSVQLGSQDPQVQELREMRGCLMELLRGAPPEATTAYRNWGWDTATDTAAAAAAAVQHHLP